MRDLPWCSIDNDDSRDLDQLTWAEKRGNTVRALVAVADVDALVKKDTPIDGHAHTNTTSVYTAARIFAMLPEKLSTDLTSLNQGQDRVAMVVDMIVGEDGTVGDGDVYRAVVRNQAKLAYDSVAAWLDGKGPDAAADQSHSGSRREASAAGQGRGQDARAPSRARRARSRDDRSEGRSSTTGKSSISARTCATTRGC